MQFTLSVSFGYDDDEEAVSVFTENFVKSFARAKEAVGKSKSPKRLTQSTVTALKQAASMEADQPPIGPADLIPSEPASTPAMALDPFASLPTPAVEPKKRGRPAKSKAQMTPYEISVAVASGGQEKQERQERPSPLGEAPARQERRAPAPPVRTVTLDDVRKLTQQIVKDQAPLGTSKILDLQKEFGGRKWPELKPDELITVFAKLQAMALNDAIPF